jgi:hypothetical protein
MVTIERSWAIKDADDNILNVFEGEANNDFIGQAWADGVLISSVEQLPDVTIEVDEPSAYDLLREDRNKALAESDWTQFNDSPLSGVKKQEWATYRQQLRDLPANTDDPANPVWPIQPS